MSDIRTLLETFTRLDEAQKHKFLDVIVDKYAKEDMDIGDYEKMFADAVKAEYDGNLGAFGRALMTKDFKTKYVLAHAAKKIGLPGLYKPNGSFVKLDDEGEPQSSRGGSKKQAIAVGKRGLLPEKLRKKFAERFPEEDAFTKKSSTKDIDAQGAAAADAGMNNQPTDKKASGSDKSGGSGDDVDAMGAAAADAGLNNKPKAKNLTKLDKASAEKAVQDKLSRMLELISALEESAVIFRNAGILTERELTPAEAEELKKLQDELGQLAQNPNVSNINKRQISAQLDRVPEDIPTQEPSDSDDSQASPAGDYRPPKFEPEPVDTDAEPEAEPEAEPAREPSGSLDAFSKANQGGLANNPEETAAIKELQTELQALGFDPKGIDGKYGPGTVAAVKAFQTSKGLKADGDAGPDTIAAILRAEPEPKTNEPAASGEGEELLKQIKALLDKASIKPDVTSTVDSPIAASIDFNSSIGKGIYEKVNLKEALSSEDQMKLQGLLNKLNKNHPELAKQNAKLFKQAQTFIKTGKVAAPGAKVGGKVPGPSGGTLPNSDSRGQKPNTGSSTGRKARRDGAPATKATSTKTTPGKPQSGTFISKGPTGFEDEPGVTTKKTSTDATMKGVVITSAIRKSPEWKQFYKKPIAPKRSLEQAAIRKADTKYKRAIAQGKIKPPKGANVDAKTTTTTPAGKNQTVTTKRNTDGTRDVTFKGKQGSQTAKDTRAAFDKMDREMMAKRKGSGKGSGKAYASNKGIQTDF